MNHNYTPTRLLLKDKSSWLFILITVLPVISIALIGLAASNNACASEHDALLSFGSESENVTVPLYKSRLIRLNQPTKKISVGNPEIADILILRSRQLYIQGKDLGTTNVLLWDSSDKLIASLNVEVTHDLNSLKAKLHDLLPDESIEVYSSQGSIVLKGEVSSLAKMDIALQVARSFALTKKAKEAKKTVKLADPVVNMMSIGGSQQVMLKVTVAEMQRTVLKQLGLKFNAAGIGDNNWTFGGVNGGATFPDALFDPGATRVLNFARPPVVGPVIDEFLPNPLSIANTGMFGSFLSDTFLLNTVLEASKDTGAAKILAEPTLTTLSGQEAKFLSGGEFPIPVPRGDDGITITFKEFGVGVQFVPVILDSGRINLKLNISVSELAAPNSVLLSSDDTVSTFIVPALTLRRANSTVELANGQTMGIAGLISENTRDAVQKFPGLGDIPILGHLFRSQEFEKGETELVIMVTPHLAKPINKNKIHLPTDDFVDPSVIEFYLLGKGMVPSKRGSIAQLLDQKAGKSALDMPEGGGVEGTFGHDLGDDEDD
ncbi:MAG: type II and III secretion system protein family protein [Pseudomonadales bacterium]